MPQAQPINLIEAKGRYHIGKADAERRRASELKVPDGGIEAPAFLTKKQKEKFDHYAELLQNIGIMKELDVDCLARYIVAHDQYISYTKKSNREPDIDAKIKLANLADKSFNQAHKCATALGLTITSRCKLTVLPEQEELDEL